MLIAWGNCPCVWNESIKVALRYRDVEMLHNVRPRWPPAFRMRAYREWIAANVSSSMARTLFGTWHPVSSRSQD